MRPAALLCYGAFGLPLAMVALPIYVYVPQFYAGRSGLGLAAIGAALLLARLAAACVDPALGRWMARGGDYAGHVRLALAPLLLGFVALFHPPPLRGAAAMAWFLAALALAYLGFSLATIAHQSWGAALSQAPGPRARLTAAREGCGLLGVMLAAGLGAAYGYTALSLAFAAALLGGAGCLLLKAPRPPRAAAGMAGAGPWSGRRPAPLLAPLRGRRFRALFIVAMVNGVAAAIPATLFLFFADDVLGLGATAGWYLLLYFLCAAASLAPWAALARRVGEARAWVAGMLLAALVFVWAWRLGAGDSAAFGAICAASGLALGADLALPPALLAGVIARAGHSGAGEGAYFGLWHWGVQMNLALAAGVALPLLAWLGYVPGAAHGTAALSFAYALLPCALKLLAAALLWRAPLRDC
jgi:GPH family glycoside/pentoside/hexuronide:cation symporter